jgi:hypothetical protein
MTYEGEALVDAHAYSCKGMETYIEDPIIWLGGDTFYLLSTRFTWKPVKIALSHNYVIL